MTALHKTLTPEKWSGFTLKQQILMVNNEISRAISWQMKNEPKSEKKCYERAFELLDLTISGERSRVCRLNLLHVRESIAILYLNVGNNNISLTRIIFDHLNMLANQSVCQT